MPNQTQSRFARIDALRGIAALLVVWQHTSESFIQLRFIAKHGTDFADVSKDFDFGRIGIICFFLISGFVIPSSLKRSDKKPLQKFFIRRLFRLYPAYWLSIILIILLGVFNSLEIQLRTVIANTTMLQSFFHQPHLIGLYWTLQIELIFYGLCALLFYLGRLHNIRFIFLLIVVFFLIFVFIQGQAALTKTPLVMNKEFQLLPYLLSIMFLGSFYRKIYDQSVQDKKLIIYTVSSTVLCLGLPLFLLAASLMEYHIIDDSFRFGISHSLAFSLFFLGLVFLKYTPKLLVWLGTISYSLYLFHPLVMKILFQITYKYPLLLDFHVSIFLIATIIMSIGLASLVYYLIERPAIYKSHQLTHDK